LRGILSVNGTCLDAFSKGVLLYGPPGTGKTLVRSSGIEKSLLCVLLYLPCFFHILTFRQLARALACNINASFLKVVASAIVDKYIGESARVIREM
jgi:26S proteasome regulatory subunit T4